HIQADKITLFADDSTMVVTAQSPEELQAAVARVFTDFRKWCEPNELILNINKSVILKFNNHFNPSDSVTFNYNGNVIQSSYSTKFLGTIIDSVSWHEQIDFVCKKINKA